MALRPTSAALLGLLVGLVAPDVVASFDPSFDKDFSDAEKNQRMKACWLQTMAHISANRGKVEAMAAALVEEGEASKKSEGLTVAFKRMMFSCYVNIREKLILRTIATETHIEDVVEHSLLNDGHLLKEATSSQQEFTTKMLKDLNAEQKKKKADMNARHDELKEKEADANTRMANAQAKFKDQMVEAHKGGLVTAKEMNEKLRDLGVAVPKPMVFEFSFADHGAFQLREVQLNKKLRALGLELSELEQPETATKNDQGEWSPVQIPDASTKNWLRDLRYTLHVTDEQMVSARERLAGEKREL